MNYSGNNVPVPMSETPTSNGPNFKNWLNSFPKIVLSSLSKFEISFGGFSESFVVERDSKLGEFNLE